MQYKILDKDIPINKMNKMLAKNVEGFDFYKEKT